MARWHRMFPVVGLLVTLLVVSGWSIAQAAGPVSPLAEEPRAGLSVTHVPPESEEPLMPGGRHRESFVISTEADSVYGFSLRLSSPEQSVDRLRVRIEDGRGRTLYEGPAPDAAFSGRRLSAGQTDRITVQVYAEGSGDGLVPGATINQAWTVTAQAG